MQAKVGISIAKNIDVALSDKSLECSTLLNAHARYYSLSVLVFMLVHQCPDTSANLAKLLSFHLQLGWSTSSTR